MIMTKISNYFFFNCLFIIIVHVMQYSMNAHIIYYYHCKSYVLTIFATVGAWNTQPQLPMCILFYCYKRGQLVRVKDSMTTVKDAVDSHSEYYLLILNWIYIKLVHSVFMYNQIIYKHYGNASDTIGRRILTNTN